MDIIKEETPIEGKPVVVAGKDYIVLSHDNIAEVEQFLNVRLEASSKDWYAFPNDGKSRRTMVGDHLMLDGERVVIWPKKNFKDTYEIGK